MAKAIAIVSDVNSFDVDVDKFRLTVACSVRPTGGDTFGSFKKEVAVLLTGSENPNQINTAINTAVKAAATAEGVTLADADISSTKFS